MAWKPNERKMHLDNTLQIETWKQKINYEQREAKMRTAAAILNKRDLIGTKNSYINIYKDEQIVNKENSEKFVPKNYVFDQVMRDQEIDNSVPRGYCQKAKRESMWCAERRVREEPKAVQHAPLTSAQVVGWRPPIDNLMKQSDSLNRTGICWRTFHDKGHL